MGFYIITYDLRQPGKDYAPLYDAIKSYGEWQHPLESVWLIHTVSAGVTADTIYDRLRPVIDDSDFLFINHLDPNDKQGWMVKSFWNWYNGIIRNN